MPDEAQLAIIGECLRQIWQIHDDGGHSVGRSRESVLLETAMCLLQYDHRHSSLADNNREAFYRLAEDARYDQVMEELKQHDQRQAAAETADARYDQAMEELKQCDQVAR